MALCVNCQQEAGTGLELCPTCQSIKDTAPAALKGLPKNTRALSEDGITVKIIIPSKINSDEGDESD